MAQHTHTSPSELQPWVRHTAIAFLIGAFIAGFAYDLRMKTHDVSRSDLAAQHTAAPVTPADDDSLPFTDAAADEQPVEQAIHDASEVVRIEPESEKKPIVDAAPPSPISPLDPSPVDRLIDLAHLLPADYVPADLVPAADYGITAGKSASSPEMQLRLAQDTGTTDPSANMPSRLAAMLAACETETGERVQLRSGYRSYATQAALFRARGYAGGNIAPGASEHQSGLAADFAIGGQFLTTQSKTYNCLSRIASDYGFIQSYPAGNRYIGGYAITEPWHWRYVGPEAAIAMRAVGQLGTPFEFLATLPVNQQLMARR